MNAQKSVELTLRASMILKTAAEIVGVKDVLVARLCIKELKEQIRSLETFLNTAEVDK